MITDRQHPDVVGVTQDDDCFYLEFSDGKKSEYMKKPLRDFEYRDPNYEIITYLCRIILEERCLR